jgi:GNAT superfamily N-acetyltransferase
VSATVDAVTVLTPDEVEWLATEAAKAGRVRNEEYFGDCCRAQTRGEMVFLVARAGTELLGFVRVLWNSEYAPFRERMIPEINDLYVTPARRRQGIASRLMDEAEAVISTRSPVAGIGVGIHPGYAPAQRMYALRGYVPDGNPLTYKGEFVRERQQVVLDDDLAMYLTRSVRTGSVGGST